MFDSHAHPGTPTDDAFVCTASTKDIQLLSPFRFRALGWLPESGSDPDFDLLDKAAVEGIHIGEIGLDRRFGDKEKQEMIFRTALSIASDHSRVAVVHIVREYGRALSILREMRPERFIVHGFTGSLETAREIISLGGIISLSPRAERTSAFDELLKLPFATETDMETGEEEMRELMAWNGRLSELTGIDIGARSERMMKEILA